MPTYLQHENQSIYICGYACVYGTRSNPLHRYGGRSEIVERGAFDQALARAGAGVSCRYNHSNSIPAIASVDHDLELWSDGRGLGYRAGPLSIDHAWLVRLILRSEARGASWKGSGIDAEYQEVDGEEMLVVRRVNSLLDIGPAYQGTNSWACTWCSHELPYDLPASFRAVAEKWQAGRTAHLAATAGASRSSRTVKSKPQAQTGALRRSVEFNDWAMPPRGWLRHEWIAFGRAEAAGRRAHEAEQRRRRNRRQSELAP